MPHTSSAKKRLRQNIQRRLRNRAALSDLKTHVKRVLAAIKAGDTKAAEEQLAVVYHKYDKAAARRYVHPNNAHRHKARLAKRIKQMGAAAG